MKRIVIISSLFMSSLVFLLIGCGGGGSGASPQPATSVTTGEISGFGSVIVNGVKFSRKSGLTDDRVKLRFENNTSAREDNLRIGMIVKIRGEVNSSAGTGEYESIEFQPEIRGPLDNAGVDLVNNKLTVMGREVQIEARTSFDSIKDLAEINGELQAGRHPELEISGNMDSAGVFHATRIGRKSVDFTNGVVEIKGAIAASPAPTTNGFSIGTRAIVVDNTTVFQNMVRADIAAGLLVEVKGNLNAGVFSATRVEKKNAVEAEVNDNVRVKGTAVGTVSNNSFILNGPNGAITIRTAAASFVSGGAAATSAIVTAGAVLEVEGALQADGSVKATKVSVELEKSVRLEGNAGTAAFSAADNTLTLNGVATNLSPVTRLIDRNGTALTLSSIVAGDHLQISGVLDNTTGKVSASQVQRTNASSVSFIQGPVSAAASPNLTLLGISVVTSGATQFQKSDKTVLTQATFFAALTPGVTVVKAKGSVGGTILTATEAEIELQ